MRKEQIESRLIRSLWRLGWLSALTIGVVLLSVQPTHAATEDDNQESPITNVHQEGGPGTNIQVETDIQGAPPNQGEDAALDAVNEHGSMGCHAGTNCRVRVYSEDGTLIHSTSYCNLHPSACGHGGSYTSPPPTTPPETPSAPTLATPTLMHTCSGSGWIAQWTPWASSSTLEYESEWEAQWRLASDPAGVWQSAAVVPAGDDLMIGGVPQPEQTVEVQVRGQARRRAGNSIGWSDWSEWSSWSSWRATASNCPPPTLPSPTVTACRSAAGIEVEWTVPPGTWRTGTGWVMDANEVDAVGNLIGFLAAYSRDSSNSLIPWADRSITLPVPSGTRVLITVYAYAPGRYGTQGQDLAEATVESGCGVPLTLPPAPPVPAAPVAPVPISPVLTCADDGSGGLTARASWMGQADTDSYAEAYEVEWSVDRSGSVTTIVRPTVSHYDEPPVELTSADGLASGDVVSFRVRAQAAAQASATNSVGTTWSGWSSFGAWSAWSTASSTSTCPTPTPLIPPGSVCPSDPTQQAAFYPSGHAEWFDDANGNGSYDTGERFTDINGDGTWTADLGGHPTGVCYPPGHTCLTQLCLPRGS